MRRRLALLAPILLLPTFAPCAPCFHGRAGLYSDSEFSPCDIQLVQYQPVETALRAHLGSQEEPLAELRLTIDSLPVQGTGGVISAAWAHPPDEGDLYSELVWRWDPPLEPTSDWLELGTIIFFWVEADWFEQGQSFLCAAEPALDHYGQSYFLCPETSFLNCDPFTCFCFVGCGIGYGPWIKVRDVSPAPGAVVSGQFLLTFGVESVNCLFGDPTDVPYDGDLLLDGTSLGTFAAKEPSTHEITIDVSGHEPGSTVTVEIRAANDAQTVATLEYLIDGPTGIGSVDGNGSLSLIKSLY